MKPKKYPYLEKIKLTKKELPRFVKLGRVAFNSDLIKHIEVIKFVAPNQTLIYFKIPLFAGYEKKETRVNLDFYEVVKILNQI